MALVRQDKATFRLLEPKRLRRRLGIGTETMWGCRARGRVIVKKVPTKNMRMTATTLSSNAESGCSSLCMSRSPRKADHYI